MNNSNFSDKVMDVITRIKLIFPKIDLDDRQQVTQAIGYFSNHPTGDRKKDLKILMVLNGIHSSLVRESMGSYGAHPEQSAQIYYCPRTTPNYLENSKENQ